MSSTGSTYCVTAHCEMVRMLKIEGPEPEQIAIDHVHAKIPMADKALLNCTAQALKKPEKLMACLAKVDTKLSDKLIKAGGCVSATTVRPHLGACLASLQTAP